MQGLVLAQARLKQQRKRTSTGFFDDPTPFAFRDFLHDAPFGAPTMIEIKSSSVLDGGPSHSGSSRFRGSSTSQALVVSTTQILPTDFWSAQRLNIPLAISSGAVNGSPWASKISQTFGFRRGVFVADGQMVFTRMPCVCGKHPARLRENPRMAPLLAWSIT